MATFAALQNRADELRRLGLTAHRVFRRLRMEFPNAERDMLVNAARLPGHRRGITPELWAQWGQALRPTQIRFQAKKGAPHATRSRGASKKGGQAGVVLPKMPVDDGRWAPLPAPRRPAVDAELARTRPANQSGRSHSPAGPSQGRGIQMTTTREAIPLTVPARARDVDPGDWVDGHGLVSRAWHSERQDKVVVKFEDESFVIFKMNDRVYVRLEDYGISQ